jgi:hypothetical protein
MKTKKKKDPKEQSRKYIKILAYLMFFYFGIRLILVPVIFSAGAADVMGGIIGLVINIAIIVLGLVAAFYLLKMKKWALTTLVVLFIINIVSVFVAAASYGVTKIPLVQIAILIMIINGYKQLKNVK